MYRVNKTGRWLVIGWALWLLAACSAPPKAPLTATGYLEAPRYRLSAEVGGLVADRLVEEGASVAAGEVLLRLRASEVEAAVAQAQAKVEQAQAALDALQERPAAAERAAAQAEVAKAQAQLEQARGQLQRLRDAYAPLSPPPEQEAVLAAQVRVAEAAFALARARLDLVEAGPTTAEQAQAQAALAAAQAEYDLARWRQERLTLSAPVEGVLARWLVQPGEVVRPGQPVALLDAAGPLEIVVYLPAGRLPEVWVGQPAEVRVDAYPEQVFTARVVRIAEEAQFTPSETLSRDERVRRVFAVTLRLTERTAALHPGMLADVTLSATGHP